MSTGESNGPVQVAEQFLQALVTNTSTAFKAILDEDVGMRMARWDGGEAHRGRTFVAGRLMREWSAWTDPTLETLSVLVQHNRAAVEFRIQATEDNRYMEYYRSAFLTLRDSRVQTIDLYCGEPLPSARRKNWIAPATLSEQELDRLFETWNYTHDIREWIRPDSSGYLNRRIMMGESAGTHPGTNGVAGARWSAEEADARIEELVAHFRERNAGFNWFVGPFDTPADLRERLERHGLALAGDQAMMARLGLEGLDDIPVNPEIEIEMLDGSNEDSNEAALQILAACFNWTPEQVEERRRGSTERLKDPKVHERELFYLGRLNGQPVADAHLVLMSGIAYLGGACTLHAYRNRKIYSTLLRRRLEDACARGYQVAAIHAEPMSRRVVSRYGFREYARSYLYAWMPVMDMQVVRSLVPDE